MKATIHLDPDAYVFARAYAGGRGISFSAAISELVRRAERMPEPGVLPGRLERNEHGYLEIAKTGHAVTPEMVMTASEDEVS